MKKRVHNDFVLSSVNGPYIARATIYNVFAFSCNDHIISCLGLDRVFAASSKNAVIAVCSICCSSLALHYDDILALAHLFPACRIKAET